MRSFWLTVVTLICGLPTSSGWSQVTVYSPVLPTLPVLPAAPATVWPAPAVVAKPAVVLPGAPLMTAPLMTAPVPVLPLGSTVYRPTYSVLSPAPAVVGAPVAVPVYSGAIPYRTGYVGSSIVGTPTVYTPGQPLRNVLRYAIP